MMIFSLNEVVGCRRDPERYELEQPDRCSYAARDLI